MGVAGTRPQVVFQVYGHLPAFKVEGGKRVPNPSRTEILFVSNHREKFRITVATKDIDGFPVGARFSLNKLDDDAS